MIVEEEKKLWNKEIPAYISSAPLWIQITLLMMMKNSLSPSESRRVVDVKIILCLPSYPILDSWEHNKKA